MQEVDRGLGTTDHDCGASSPQWDEPVLDTRQIQGTVLPGFDTSLQLLVFLQLRDVRAAKAWIAQQSASVATMANVLAARDASEKSHTWMNIGVSYSGLRKLTRDATRFTDVAFREGMWTRSPLLGDSADPADEGHYRNWVIGSPDRDPDVLVIIGAESRESIARGLQQLRRATSRAFGTVYTQVGSSLRGRKAGREHFGFRDPISQPALRGRLSDRVDDFFTARNAGSAYGRGGHRLIWPGEFVFGYPEQDPTDTVHPGAVSPAGPQWARNGSFLVVRRLRQDVERFESFLRDQARSVATLDASLADFSPAKLGAKLVGRWQSGAPLRLASDCDDTVLGGSDERNNDFSYLGQSPNARDNGLEGGDSFGVTCPLAAHIRRAYPRDDTPAVSRADVERHRLLRRGIPFGSSRSTNTDRGLLFLAYQTSFVRQFEFVTRAWLNNPHVRHPGDGLDPIVGQHASGASRRFSMPIKRQNSSIDRVVMELPRWVTPTGGGYFLYHR